MCPGNTADDPYDTPSMQTTHGFIETVLWEVYAWGEDFFKEDEFDDYLYTWGEEGFTPGS